MPLSENTVSAQTINSAPSTEEVKQIAGITDPVLRNLQITQCYCELSSVFAKRTGNMANWCSYATWASKQAGQTIRKEDLKRALEVLLEKQGGIEGSLMIIISMVKKLGAKQSVEFLRQCGLAVVLESAANRAGDAVSRGNKKVFEEIGLEFARFISTCFIDKEYSQKNIDDFCQSLRPGDPPEGQEFLRKAFSNYYQSFFENDAKKKTEGFLLANLQIGFHEQTRLQPEIAEALNAAISNPKELQDRLINTLFTEVGFLAKIRLFFQRLFGRTALLDKAAEDFIVKAQLLIRTALTAHLMTLTMPPGTRLQLAKDLAMAYHDDLKEIRNPLLLELLSRVDPTPNSLQQSGASDWADLKERMHFIAELFRCYHSVKDIFAEAFTIEQVMQIKQGRLPTGSL